MDELIVKLKEDFSEIIKKSDPEEIREFFKPKENLDELVVKCVMFGHYFLGRYFYKPTPDFHYELVERFFRPGNDYTACPRGFSKTTINQLCILFSCVNGLDEFIVLIEKTYTEAAEVLEAVREESKMNDDLIRVYGDLTKVNTKGKDQDNIRDSTGDFFVNGVRLRAKGFDTPIRGLKSRHSRPTRVLLDDCESDEHIENVEQRTKYLNNYIKGVIPAVDNDTGVIKMWGTILHDDSLLNTLIKNHNGKVYRAWDDKRELLWPSNWTVEKLEQKREEMRIEGKGDASFYQEYFNEPLDEENQIFCREMFRYFNGFQLTEKILKKPHRIYTLVDPAISKKTTADFTAIVTVLVDELNVVYILQITRARLDPLETIKAIFAHYEKWNPYFVAIETTAYQKSLKYFINEEKLRQKSTVQTMMVVEIKPTIDKVTKIGKMQPKYALANFFHNSDDPNTTILEEELLRFPKGVHDDICFVAGTKILTVNGEKNIEDINIGDLVMTRDGYRAVDFWAMTGKKEVVTNIGLTGTHSHPVIVKKFGMDWIKNLTDVSLSDTLYIWNEKLSCIEEKNIIDTLIPEGVNLRYIFGDTTSGKALPLRFIAKYGLIILGKYLKNIMSIIKMGIRSTMRSLILGLFIILNMRAIIQKKGGVMENIEKRDLKISTRLGILQKNGTPRKKGESGISIIIKIFGKIGNLSKFIAFSVARNLRQWLKPQNIAQPTTELNLEKKINKELKEVYNLRVEGAHEYFANGILVHNCDCLSNVIEIIIPVQKTVQRKYRAHVKNRQASVMY